MKTYWLIILMATALAPRMGATQTLEDYLLQAARDNPGLKAAYNEYLAALERSPQVGAMPNPELSMGFFVPEAMEFPMGFQRGQVTYMQMFPWFGMLRAQQKEADQMALMRLEAFRESKNQLFYDLRTTYYRLYRQEAEIRLIEENLALLAAMERQAISRFQNSGGGTPGGNVGRSPAPMGEGPARGMNDGMSGGAPPSSGMAPARGGGMGAMADVLRLHLEIREMENSLTTLIEGRRPLLARFNQLLNRPLNTPAAMPDTLLPQSMPADQLSLLDSIRRAHPMIGMLKAENAIVNTQLEMNRLDGRPMLGAGLSYMIFSPHRDGGVRHGGGDMLMPMAAVTLPIFRRQYKAKATEIAIRQELIQQRKEDVGAQLAVALTEAMIEGEDAARRIRLYQDQQVTVRRLESLLLTAYSAGVASFEETLNLRQTALDFRRQLLYAIVDQHLALAMIDMLASRY
jgi:outer membrane protein TolC